MQLRGWRAVALALCLGTSALAQEDGASDTPPTQTEPAPGPDQAASPSPSAPAPIDFIAPKHKDEESHGGPGSSAFELGLRLDAQLPLGDTFQGTSLKSMVAGQAALQLDLGWRIDPRWEVGAFFRYGLSFVNGCTDTVSCSATDLRLGVEGQVHLLPAAAFDPWLGLGVGYEFLTLTSSGAAAPPANVAVETTVTYKGLSFLTLDAGADYRLTDSLGAGPYVEASIGQFSSTQNSGVTNTSLHLWLGLGFRGWFDVH